MLFHIGKDIMVSSKEIIMILDYNKIKKSMQSNNFLLSIEKKGLSESQAMQDKESKTIIVTQNKILFSPIASGTIEKRMGKSKY